MTPREKEQLAKLLKNLNEEMDAMAILAEAAGRKLGDGTWDNLGTSPRQQFDVAILTAVKLAEAAR